MGCGDRNLLVNMRSPSAVRGMQVGETWTRTPIQEHQATAWLRAAILMLRDMAEPKQSFGHRYGKPPPRLHEVVFRRRRKFRQRFDNLLSYGSGFREPSLGNAGLSVGIARLRQFLVCHDVNNESRIDGRISEIADNPLRAAALIKAEGPLQIGSLAESLPLVLEMAPAMPSVS